MRIEVSPMKHVPCLAGKQCTESLQETRKIDSCPIDTRGIKVGRLDGDTHRISFYRRANKILPEKVALEISDIRAVHHDDRKTFFFCEF